jgi:hypothetical protein
VLVTAAGLALTISTLLAMRSDRYIRWVIRNVLITYRRPITSAALERRVAYLRAALAVGVAVGLIVIVLGVVTLVKGL